MRVFAVPRSIDKSLEKYPRMFLSTPRRPRGENQRRNLTTRRTLGKTARYHCRLLTTPKKPGNSRYCEERHEQSVHVGPHGHCARPGLVPDLHGNGVNEFRMHTCH